MAIPTTPMPEVGYAVYRKLAEACGFSTNAIGGNVICDDKREFVDWELARGAVLHRALTSHNEVAIQAMDALAKTALSASKSADARKVEVWLKGEKR